MFIILFVLIFSHYFMSHYWFTVLSVLLIVLISFLSNIFSH